MNPEAIGELLNELDKVREEIPVITGIIHSFGPEVKAALMPILEGAAELKALVFQKYLNLGFSREEALALTINDGQNWKQAVTSIKR